jgi:hypothetical protein
MMCIVECDRKTLRKTAGKQIPCIVKFLVLGKEVGGGKAGRAKEVGENPYRLSP